MPNESSYRLSVAEVLRRSLAFLVIGLVNVSIEVLPSSCCIAFYLGGSAQETRPVTCERDEVQLKNPHWSFGNCK